MFILKFCLLKRQPPEIVFLEGLCKVIKQNALLSAWVQMGFKMFPSSLLKNQTHFQPACLKWV
jgi:hypothetical protein